MAVVEADSRYGTPVAAARQQNLSGSKVAAAPPGGMPFTPDHCQGITRAGAACSARPVKGGELCYGHSRGADA